MSDTAEVNIQWTSHETGISYILWVAYDPNAQAITELVKAVPEMDSGDRELFDEISKEDAELIEKAHLSFEGQFSPELDDFDDEEDEDGLEEEEEEDEEE